MWSLSKSRCRGFAVSTQLSHASGTPSWSASGRLGTGGLNHQTAPNLTLRLGTTAKHHFSLPCADCTPGRQEQQCAPTTAQHVHAAVIVKEGLPAPASGLMGRSEQRFQVHSAWAGWFTSVETALRSRCRCQNQLVRMHSVSLCVSLCHSVSLCVSLCPLGSAPCVSNHKAAS